MWMFNCMEGISNPHPHTVQEQCWHYTHLVFTKDLVITYFKFTDYLKTSVFYHYFDETYSLTLNG